MMCDKGELVSGVDRFSWGKPFHVFLHCSVTSGYDLILSPGSGAIECEALPLKPLFSSVT